MSMRGIGLATVVLVCIVASSAAGEYEIGGLLIGGYQNTDAGDGHYETFLVRAARINASVTVADKVKAFVQADLAQQPVILDAFVDYSHSPLLNLRVGQFQLPFGHENQISKFDLLATARSLMVGCLLNNGFSSPYVRDVGIMLSGRRKLLEYKVAFVNGSGYSYSNRPWLDGDGVLMISGRDNDNSKDLVGRVGLGIPMFAGIGYSFYRGKWNVDSGQGDTDRTAHGFDFFVNAGKIVIEYEHLWATGRLDDIDQWKPVDYGGWYLLVGYRVKRFIQPVYKVDICDPDKDTDGDLLMDQYLGVNLRVHPAARFQFFYKESSVARHWRSCAFLAQLAARW